jgi:hypothetical protein
MKMRSAIRFVVVGVLLLLPGASVAGSRYDGDWVTHLACEGHGETPAYKFEFPSIIWKLKATSHRTTRMESLP